MPIDLPPHVVSVVAMKPAGDPQQAVQAEFDVAVRTGTVAAWQLFLARHPDNALARQARCRLQALTASGVR